MSVAEMLGNTAAEADETEGQLDTSIANMLGALAASDSVAHKYSHARLIFVIFFAYLFV